MTNRPPRSLKARALQLLAQREQSRVELRRKLVEFARAAEADSAAETAQADSGGTDETAASASRAVQTEPLASRVDSVLDWLEAHGYLSSERFAESRAHARASRYGNLRIRQELKQHGALVSPEIAQSLAESELARASAVRARKFAEAPLDAAGKAKQSRFLAGRGFTPDVIRRVLREAKAQTDGGAAECSPSGAHSDGFSSRGSKSDSRDPATKASATDTHDRQSDRLTPALRLVR